MLGRVTYLSPHGRDLSALDRVEDRRRAARLARHYRDVEQLSIAEIARRLGRAHATVKAYLYDPTGEKARAVKRRYQACAAAAARRPAARNGKGDAYARLQDLPPRRHRPRVDARARARRDARLARALRHPAVLL